MHAEFKSELGLESGKDGDYVVVEGANRNDSDMTWFQAFRGDFGFSNYGEYRTSVTADIPFAAIIYSCILFSLAFLVAAAGIRGKERWYTLGRLIYSLFIGSIILASLFGYCWQLGKVGVHSRYIYRHDGQIEGFLGVRIGLKTANLTLAGSFLHPANTFKYNEEIILSDVLSPTPQLWQALDRGLPQPLLSIMEYFDTDMGGLRFGRACWLAGHLANILLWTAFAFWVTGNILLCSVIWYGAALFTLTGVCMTASAVVYDALSPQTTIILPCANDVIKLSYHWCFWSVLICGIITTVIGLVLFALEHKAPKKLAEFFLLETSYDEDAADEYQQLRLQSLSASPSLVHTPSFARTPDLTLNRMGRRTPSDTPVHSNRRTPSNWVIGYPSDSNHKENPVFTFEPETSFTGNGSVPYDGPRLRSVSDIKEEDDSKVEPAVSDKVEAAIDRLHEIYVDVEPSHKTGLYSSPVNTAEAQSIFGNANGRRSSIPVSGQFSISMDNN